MYQKEYFQGIATLTGCIIGAGILGIPYVVAKAGFWTGLLVILLVGFAMLVVHVMVGDIASKSKKCRQLVGYSEQFLGRKGKFLMLLSMVVGIYGAMVAYTIGVSASLSSIFGGPQIIWAVLFYLIMSAIVLGGIGVLGNSELWLEGIKILAFLLILVFLFFSPNFSASNLTGFSVSSLLVPYGVILFAFIGTAAVPEVCEEMKRCRHLARRAIIIGSLIPIIAYALFALGVVGVAGNYITEIASIGVAEWIGWKGALLVHLFAILAMTTSFAALAYALKEAYWKDLGFTHLSSWSLTMLVPAVLLGLGVDSFVRTLELSGSFAGGIAGILIVLMHKNISRSSFLKKSGYALLLLLFIVGMAYQFLTL